MNNIGDLAGLSVPQGPLLLVAPCPMAQAGGAGLHGAVLVGHEHVLAERAQTELPGLTMRGRGKNFSINPLLSGEKVQTKGQLGKCTNLS